MPAAPPPAGPAAPTGSRPAHFRIAVPPGWATLDLSGEDLRAAHREAMARATSVAERLQIDSLVAQARQLVRTARRRGALWGAGTATLYDDGLFVGHLMVFAVALPDEQDLTLPVLSRTLQRPAARDDDLGRRTIAPVELPQVGTAVRVTGLERVRITDRDEATMVVSHTFVPVPGQPGARLLITGSSPNVPLAPAVLDLFDAAASTFRFT